MLTIICGEDTSTSRLYYNSLIQQYSQKDYRIIEIVADQLDLIPAWLSDSYSLFETHQVFSTELLNKKLKRQDTMLIKIIEDIANDKNNTLIVWEPCSKRELKYGKLSTVKEFKPKDTIFKLLDSLYPGNKKNFISALSSISQTTDPFFIFSMVSKHTRTLLLAKSDIFSSRLQSWQISKIKYSARVWNLEKLTRFYEGLCRVDRNVKTSSSPFDIAQSLDILACYFL